MSIICNDACACCHCTAPLNSRPGVCSRCAAKGRTLADAAAAERQVIAFCAGLLYLLAWFAMGCSVGFLLLALGFHL